MNLLNCSVKPISRQENVFNMEQKFLRDIDFEDKIMVHPQEIQ